MHLFALQWISVTSCDRDNKANNVCSLKGKAMGLLNWLFGEEAPLLTREEITKRAVKDFLKKGRWKDAIKALGSENFSSFAIECRECFMYWFEGGSPEMAKKFVEESGWSPSDLPELLHSHASRCSHEHSSENALFCLEWLAEIQGSERK